MKRITLLILLVNQFAFGQIVNIPDSIFKSYVLSKCDTNFDGNVQIDEALLIDSLVIEIMGINDLTGMEYFTNLYWIQCGGNNISTLNTANNPALEFIHCNGNELTNIDVSHNPNLYYLECRYNQLSELDFRNGNNVSYLYLDTRDNPDLNCISVDDTSFAYSSPYYYHDPWTSYQSNCSLGITETIDRRNYFTVENNFISSKFDGEIRLYNLTSNLLLTRKSPTSFQIERGLYIIQINSQDITTTYKMFIE